MQAEQYPFAKEFTADSRLMKYKIFLDSRIRGNDSFLRSVPHITGKRCITDAAGQIRQVILDFSDYQRLLEAIEDEGLYRAMMEVKDEIPLDLEAALAELETE